MVVPASADRFRAEISVLRSLDGKGVCVSTPSTSRRTAVCDFWWRTWVVVCLTASSYRSWKPEKLCPGSHAATIRPVRPGPQQGPKVRGFRLPRRHLLLFGELKMRLWQSGILGYPGTESLFSTFSETKIAFRGPIFSRDAVWRRLHFLSFGGFKLRGRENTDPGSQRCLPAFPKYGEMKMAPRDPLLQVGGSSEPASKYFAFWKSNFGYPEFEGNYGFWLLLSPDLLVPEVHWDTGITESADSRGGGGQVLQVPRLQETGIPRSP